MINEANGLGPEAKIISEEIGDFDYRKCPVWLDLLKHFSPGVTRNELHSIAIVLVSLLDLPLLTRSENRSFPLMIRWFAKNWSKIEPVLPSIHLLDNSMNTINIYSKAYYK